MAARTNKGTRIVTLLMALGVLASAIAGCAPAATPTTAPAAAAAAATSAPEATAVPAEPTATETGPAPGGTLVVGLSWEPRTFDPHVSSSWEAPTVGKLVFDTLVYHAADDKVWPGLAIDWEVSDDGLLYTFYLRDDVTFHDGTPFTAEAVRYSFDRVVDPATKSEAAASYIEPYESTEIVDDYTVRIHLSAPLASFLDALGRAELSIVSPAAAEEWGEDFVDHMVGTGPFMFKEWVRQSHLTLVRNPDYNWAPGCFDNQGPAYLEEIVFQFLPEAVVRVGTLETGEVHLINDVPPTDYARLAADSAFATYTSVQPGVPMIIAMNVTLAPTDDVRVRQALEYAVDKQAIVDTLFEGLYDVAHGPLAPSTLGYWAGAEEMYGYDPAKSESLLEEAGWVDTDGDGIRDKDGQPLTLEWPTHEWQRTNEVAEMVQAQLREIGVDVAVNLGAWPASYEAWNNCEHNLMDSGYEGRDPDVLSTMLLSSNVGQGYAVTCIKDDHIDELLMQGRASTDQEERLAIYAELQQIIMDEALFLPVRQFGMLAATRAEVKGFQFQPTGVSLLLYPVYLEE
jgi:peptide/nickel transport system substrate-binding protein